MKIQLEQDNLVIFESALYRTTSTLIIGADYILLIDPNWLPGEISFIRGYIEELGKNDLKRYLLFTHSDYDHIIGYGEFRDFQSIASKAFVNNPDKYKILGQIRQFDNQYYISRNYPVLYPEIDISIAGDQSLALGSDLIHFYQAPGHNSDGLITFTKSAGILVLGDYLSNLEFPFIEYSYPQYLATLDKIERLLNAGSIKVMITGHGDHTMRQEEMYSRLRQSREYLDDLKASVMSGHQPDIEKLSKQYVFFPGIAEMHMANSLKVKQELKK